MHSSSKLDKNIEIFIITKYMVYVSAFGICVIPDCQYGDKQSWCSGITSQSCYLNDENCCSHCLQFETGIPGNT